MIKKEMIDNFGYDRKTLDLWEKGAKEKRKLLYDVLEMLPIEFVDNIKLIEAAKKKNLELLTPQKMEEGVKEILEKTSL